VDVVRLFQTVACKVQQQPVQRGSTGRVQGRGNGGGGADRRWIGFCIWICQMRNRISKLADQNGKIHFPAFRLISASATQQSVTTGGFSVDSFFL
jgi:hypothetical protein